MALHFHFQASEGTMAAARSLGDATDGEGLVLALEGPLGAGKTVFVKGFAAGLGIDPMEVSSPTFVIVREHRVPGGRRLAHVDLYRVGAMRELEEVGFLDLQEPGVLLAVEWSDRFPEALPSDRLEVRLQRYSETPSERVMVVAARGRQSQRVLERWLDCLPTEMLPEAE